MPSRPIDYHLSNICTIALQARKDALETCSRLHAENLDAQEWIDLELALINTELQDRERREKQRETIRREYARGTVEPFGAKAGRE